MARDIQIGASFGIVTDILFNAKVIKEVKTAVVAIGKTKPTTCSKSGAPYIYFQNNNILRFDI